MDTQTGTKSPKWQLSQDFFLSFLFKYGLYKYTTKLFQEDELYISYRFEIVHNTYFTNYSCLGMNIVQREQVSGKYDKLL